MSDVFRSRDPAHNSNWLRMVRSHYEKEMTLQMADGSLLSGQARDLNVQGFFLNTYLQPSDDLVGMRAIFLEDLYGEEVAMPCQVVRVTEKGVGLRFLES